MLVFRYSYTAFLVLKRSGAEKRQGGEAYFYTYSEQILVTVSSELSRPESRIRGAELVGWCCCVSLAAA